MTAENESLLHMYERLDAQIQQLRIIQNVEISELTGYIDQHSKIIQLLNAGDTEFCKEVLVVHILHGY